MARSGIDKYLEILLEKVEDIYTGTKSGKINNVEDYNENEVRIDGVFRILFEPATNSYTYIINVNDVKIRLAKDDLINGSALYKDGELVLYRYLHTRTDELAEELKNQIIINVSFLEAVKNNTLEEEPKLGRRI